MTTGGPDCIQADLPTSSLLQLETRPVCRGNRCLSTGWGTPERVCQFSLVPYKESSKSSNSPESPGSSHLERPTMVPSSPKQALGVPWRISSHLNLIQSPVELDLPGLIPKLAVWPTFGKS